MAVQRLSNSGRNGYSYKSLIAGVTPIPSVPTIGTATELTYASATVEFTAPGDYSGSTYTATSSPGSFTGTSATSPIVVTGLSGETTYTFTVTATNATGTSGASAASNSITTPAEFTPSSSYDALATYTVGAGGISSITFAGLPTGGQYTHLQIRGVSRTNRATYNTDNFKIRINDDTGNNYSWHSLNSAPNSPSNAANAGSESSVSYIAPFSTATSVETGIFGGAVIDVLDYASTSKYKTVRGLSGADTNGQASGYAGYFSVTSGLWRSTATVNSITLYPDYGSNFLQHTQFSIYGVR